MSLIHPKSLSATVDSVSEALFDGTAISDDDRLEVARWLANRQGLPGSYRRMFAPTEADYSEGTTLFTGEHITSGAGTGHILSEETCRLLYRLDVDDTRVRSALTRASDGFLASFEPDEGWFCCGTCSVAFWRHLQARGDQARRLRSGMRRLRQLRNGAGRWNRVPFHYTLLALTEMELPAALDELRYAKPVCEKLANSRAAARSAYSRRRREIARRALDNIQS